MKYILLMLLVLVSYPALGIECNDKQAKKDLVKTVFEESRGESYIGKVAVMQIVENRIHLKTDIYGNRDNACEVIRQKYQFSYTLKSKKALARSKELEIHTWYAIEELVEYVYHHKEQEFKKTGLTKIHSHYMTVKKWRNGSTSYERKHGCLHKIIGGHVFYALCAKPSKEDRRKRYRLMKGI